MTIKAYIPWIAAALGLFLIALAIPRPHAGDAVDTSDLPGAARARDRIRRTLKTFSQLEEEKESHPLSGVNKEGLAIDIEIDAGTFDMMLQLQNRGTYKKRSTDIAVRFAERGPRAATLSLRGGTSLRMPGKPNFDIKLLSAEEFAPGVRLKRFQLMNLRADPHHVKMVMGYRVLKELGLFPLHFQYAAVTINGEPLGMFLLVEPPVVGIQRANPGCIAIHRRVGTNAFTNDWAAAVPSATAALDDLQSLGAGGRLERPIEALSEVIDLEGCFTWLSINAALRNPDTSDELFLYEVRDDADTPRPLRLMGWDYDDIFSMRPKRDTMDDPLLFSCDGAIESLIQQHPQLYERFRATLRALLATRLHPDRLCTMLREVGALRDSLDDGGEPAAQAGERAARGLYVVEMEKVIRDRNRELMEALGQP